MAIGVSFVCCLCHFAIFVSFVCCVCHFAIFVSFVCCVCHLSGRQSDELCATVLQHQVSLPLSTKWIGS